MADAAELVDAELAAFAAAAVPVFARRIPDAPAGLLGRLGVPQPADPHPWGARRPGADEPECLTALRVLGPLVVQRLLGALELAVAAHDWGGAPWLIAGPSPPAGSYAWVAAGGHDSEATSAAAMLHRFQPGLLDRTATLVRLLAVHPTLAPLLAVAPEVTDEPAIAAAHGAAHLALAVAVAGAVVHQVAPPVTVEPTAATIGLGVGAAALLLRDAPTPPSYAPALLARVRAQYRLPRHTAGTVAVTGHCFGLAERAMPGQVDFSGNGLVAVADGAIVVRTGVTQGTVRVDLVVLADAPEELEPGWEEVVEVSWHAAEGSASVVAPDGTSHGGLHAQAPPWPGDYRARVHARGRDDLDAELEGYRLVVWAAPAAPEVSHRRTDQLGHRLRGEPVPARPAEHAYRWIRRSALSQAATVTVVTGATFEQTLRAFGADPDRPVPVDEIRRDLSLRRAHDPWATALDVGGAILVVEDNGWRGSDATVLRDASAGGRAASMFWNVNADTRLSFAEAGRLLAAFEPWGREEYPPEVARALAGLDLTQLGDRTEKGLVAVERFTGRGVTAADLARIRGIGVGYRLA